MGRGLERKENTVVRNGFRSYRGVVVRRGYYVHGLGIFLLIFKRVREITGM